MNNTHTCPFCNLLLTNGGNHIYHCKQRDKNLTKDEIKLKYIQHNFGIDILENVITDYQNLYSLPMLMNKYNIDSKSVYFLLDLKQIPHRTMSQSAKEISHEKYKQTCLKKYGVENISKVPEIQKKKENTFLLHYGVDNIWKLQDYNKKCAELHPDTHKIHMEKLHNGCMNFWNNISNNDLEILVKKVKTSKVEKNQYDSKLETRFCKILNDLNISYIRQFHLSGNKHPYDFRLLDTKIIIEINGDYWHANPEKYKAEDIINYPGNKKYAKDIWNRDNKFIKYAEKNGYKVISIWESTMKKLNDDELKEHFLTLIKNI